MVHALCRESIIALIHERPPLPRILLPAGIDGRVRRALEEAGFIVGGGTAAEAQPGDLILAQADEVGLQQAHDRLAAALREREQITETVAHDIKNPLSSILFAAQMLLQSKETPIPRQEVVRDIRTCAEAALQLIHDYLEPAGKPPAAARGVASGARSVRRWQ